MGGVGAISTTAIFAMAEELGEPKARFLALCRAMDGVYLEHVAAKQKADAEKQKLSAKTRTRR